MVLGVALLIVVITAASAISATNGLPNQGSINSFSPFSSAATSQPLVNSTFIPFPSVQFVHSGGTRHAGDPNLSTVSNKHWNASTKYWDTEYLFGKLHALHRDTGDHTGNFST